MCAPAAERPFARDQERARQVMHGVQCDAADPQPRSAWHDRRPQRQQRVARRALEHPVYRRPVRIEHRLSPQASFARHLSSAGQSPPRASTADSRACPRAGSRLLRTNQDRHARVGG